MRRVTASFPRVAHRHVGVASVSLRRWLPCATVPISAALHQRRHYTLFGGPKTADTAPSYASSSAQEAAALAQAATRDASAGGAATSATSAAPTTFLDYMDQLWSRKWFGTVTEGDIAGGAVPSAGANLSDPDVMGLFADTFSAVQHVLGWEAWAVLLMFGGLTRLVTLAFSLHGERATARMQLALPELKAPQDAFNKVYYNDLSSALDVQLSATALKSERRRVFAKYETSNMQCLAPLASSPLIMYGLYQVSRLCDNPLLDVGTSSFLWCTALTLPDPFFVLPVVFCGLTLLNFELSISREMKKGWMSNIIWGARLSCLCVVPVAATFRAGVCLYFIGMSLVGLLQPVLLRVPAVRRALRFPEAVDETEAQKKLKDADALQARMTVQFPYLSHLLSPEVEDDNQQLFKPATPSQSVRASVTGHHAVVGAETASRSHHSRVGSAATTERRRFAAGTNPLMRETPLNRQKMSDAAAAPASQKLKVTSGKGSHFASSGWKSAHVGFTEEDFVPSSFDKPDSANGRGGRSC